jgi:YihY family inner membrane protein
MIHKGWVILRLAIKKFSQIDGAEWGGAFAFHAFFSLFPLMILLVTITSLFVDWDRAGKEVIAYMEIYVPIGDKMQQQVFNTIAGVINARRGASVVAFLILVWGALKCFTTLISATNRAWGGEVSNWWRLPLKSLVLLGVTVGAVLLGMTAPVLMKMAESWLFTAGGFQSWIYDSASLFIPLLVMFFSLSLFYKLAPQQHIRFAEVWAAALCTTALLRAAETLFVLYLEKFAALNALYGAFGGIMALLLWIYFSGCIVIFGACLCAAQAEGRSAT